MNNDPGIICIQHCNDKNIYCINIPTECPICRTSLQNLLNIPTRVPYPFVRATQQLCSVVVKPTRGDFLNNYELMDDLHIGLTTSNGTVISYDWNGINKDKYNWQECLAVFQLGDYSWETQWDAILADLIKNICWDSSKYNEDEHNCFSLIMEFIIQFNCIKPSIHRVETREDFTELYIAPVILKAFKYIHLYRQIIKNYFYIYSQSTKEVLYT